MCQEHVPERFVEQIIETVAEIKLAPHEHAQTVEFPQPQFITTVVDDRVAMPRQVHSSSGHETKQSITLRFESETKVVDSTCPTENRQQKIDAVPESSEEEFRRRASYSQSGRQNLEHRMSSVRDQRDHLSRLDQAGKGDAGGSRTPQT